MQYCIWHFCILRGALYLIYAPLKLFYQQHQIIPNAGVTTSSNFSRSSNPSKNSIRILFSSLQFSYLLSNTEACIYLLLLFFLSKLSSFRLPPDINLTGTSKSYIPNVIDLPSPNFPKPHNISILFFLNLSLLNLLFK